MGPLPIFSPAHFSFVHNDVKRLHQQQADPPFKTKKENLSFFFIQPYNTICTRSPPPHPPPFFFLHFIFFIINYNSLLHPLLTLLCQISSNFVCVCVMCVCVYRRVRLCYRITTTTTTTNIYIA